MYLFFCIYVSFSSYQRYKLIVQLLSPKSHLCRNPNEQFYTVLHIYSPYTFNPSEIVIPSKVQNVFFLFKENQIIFCFEKSDSFSCVSNRIFQFGRVLLSSSLHFEHYWTIFELSILRTRSQY